MASPRAPFVNYYEVLGILQNHPQLRDALLDKQSAILTSPIEPGSNSNQELIKMILILLDPITGPEYNFKLERELASQRALAEAKQDQERKDKNFADFLNDKEMLMTWFFKFCNRPGSSAKLKQFEYAEAQKNPVGFHLDKRFTCAERIAVSEKIAGILAADLALVDGLLSSINAVTESDRLPYIWNLLETFFADTQEFGALVTRLRLFILAEKFKDNEDEKTSLVYPAPQSFRLLNEIFKSSPADHTAALTALYNSEGFLATIKSYYNASILPRKFVDASSPVLEPYIPSLRECFAYLPDKGDALGMMIINNHAEFNRFGTDETFWKNFSDAIQARASALAKEQRDDTIILSNVKIKEYLEEINMALSEYHISKVDEQAALEDKNGFFAKARVSLFSKEDGRGLLRVKMLMNLFNGAATNPVRLLILMLAVLTNTDSKKLRGRIAEKVKEQDAINLLTERLRIIHGQKYTLNFQDLKSKILDSINEKTNHPTAKADENIEQVFSEEMNLIKQLETAGSLQKTPEMKMG